MMIGKLGRKVLLERNGSRRTAYLALEQLATEPELARRLPLALAQRYHALPLAEEGGRVTVALANPDDEQARTAVLEALGPESCVVRGDPRIIDERLAEIWGDGTRRRLEVRVGAFPEPLSDELWDYARSLQDLLGAHLSTITTPAEASALADHGGRADCDLAILSGSNRRLLRQLLARPTADGRPGSRQSRVAFAILAVQEPRWPLRRILLVLCGQPPDQPAVDWVLRLASPSRASVTALAVLPPVPAMYRGLSTMEQSLASVLTAGTPLGCQMRQVAGRLVDSRVDGTLCLRQGPPDEEICREIIRGDYDLVVVAAKSCRWWLRQLKGDPIFALQRRASRPVLFVEPTTV